jgi:hypothetical protein
MMQDTPTEHMVMRQKEVLPGLAWGECGTPAEGKKYSQGGLWKVLLYLLC